MKTRRLPIINILVLATFGLAFIWDFQAGEERVFARQPAMQAALVSGVATTTRVSVANNGSQGDSFSMNPSISYDGRYVTFDSSAGNLVQGDTNEWTDVFVRDRGEGFGLFFFYLPIARNQP